MAKRRNDEMPTPSLDPYNRLARAIDLMVRVALRQVGSAGEHDDDNSDGAGAAANKQSGHDLADSSCRAQKAALLKARRSNQFGRERATATLRRR